MTFKQSITHAMARPMQGLSNFIFINMANVTVLRHDSYLDYLKPVVKVDTVAALRNSPLHMASLFLKNVISKAEEKIGHHDDKHYFAGPPLTGTILVISLASKQQKPVGSQDHQPGKHSILVARTDKVEAKPPTTPFTPVDCPRGRVLINDGYCVPQWCFVELAERTETFLDNCQTFNVNCFVSIMYHLLPGSHKRKTEVPL